MYNKILRILSLLSALFIICASFAALSPFIYAFGDDDFADLPSAMTLASADSRRILSSVNGDVKMPCGTLAKIMTALIVAENIQSGAISPQTLVTASANAQSAKGAVIWLTAGEKMSVGDLLLSMLTGNANDAAIALAEKIAQSEAAFVDMMNEKASALSMKHTHFANCTGLDDPLSYSTSNDIALLCCELVKYDFLYEYMTPWLTYIRNGETELVNFNDLVKSLDGIIGIKASKTENSHHCAAVAAKRHGECYIAVALNFEQKDDCLKSAKSLISTGFSSYKTVYPLIDATKLHNVAVRCGTEKSVAVSADITPICIPNADAELVSAVVVLPEYISAPVKKGQRLGVLAIYSDDVPICEIAITAQYSVKKETLATAFISLLETLLN